ncbi:MAG TPA: hypothetical protein VNL16_12250 [Chloroflexota bacterium]|nr:hypothetical protein [Chloroflexota bacterium]
MRPTSPDDERRPSPTQETTPAGAEPVHAATRASPRSLRDRVASWLDLLSTALAFAWTATLIGELGLSLSPEGRLRLLEVDVALWLTFVIVLLLELALSRNKLRFLRSHLVDGLAVLLPFVRVVVVARAVFLLRPAWLLRLVLVGQTAIREASDLFERQRLSYVLVVLAISTLLGAAGVYFFERDVPDSPFHGFGEALWWAATLVTTINTSADPVTLEGRILGLILRIIALAAFGFITASIASFLVLGGTTPGRSARRPDDEAVANLSREVQKLRSAIERIEQRLGTHDDSERSDAPIEVIDKRASD